MPINEYQLKDSAVISEGELEAGDQDTEIPSHNAFPLTVISTTTNTIDISGVDLTEVNIDQGDVVYIDSGSAAEIYTVNSVVDSNTIQVDESVPNATSGGLYIYHPPGATKVGVGAMTRLDGANLQAALDDIDSNGAPVKVLANNSAVGLEKGINFLDGNASSVTASATAGDTEVTIDVVESGISTSNLLNDAGFVTGIEVEKNGLSVGNQPKINFMEGTDISLGITDDNTNGEIDVQVSANVSHPSHTHIHPLHHYFAYNDITQTIAAGGSAALSFDVDQWNYGTGFTNKVSNTDVELVAKGRYMIDAQATFQIVGGNGDPAMVRMRVRKDGVPINGAVLIHEWGDRVNGQSVGWYQSITMSRIVVDATGGEVIDVLVDEITGKADIETYAQGNALCINYMEVAEVTP